MMQESKNWQIISYEVIDSTNSEAIRKSEDYFAKGVVITAREQSKGRGRRGRVWQSFLGNLFFSQLFKSKAPLWVLTYISSLSVYDSIQTLCHGLEVKIKWPNDVLVNGGKISGILIENGKNDMAVVGIGVNLKVSPESKDILYPTANLRDLGFDISREDFLQCYLKIFDRYYDLYIKEGFENIRKQWLTGSYKLGEEILVSQGSKKQKGIFKGIDESGCLLLKQEDNILKISAGDIFA